MPADYPLEKEARRRNMTVGDLVREVLRARDWNKTHAASDLDVTRQGLYNAMKLWGIPFKDPEKPVKRKRIVSIDSSRVK